MRKTCRLRTSAATLSTKKLTHDPGQEQKYLDLLLQSIRVCSTYQPKFGQGKAVSLKDFQQLYGADAFYTWFGIDHPMVYAAHKAAGGITSLYRQIGTGCERVFREMISDQLSLTGEQVVWSYTVPTISGQERRLSLDARIQTSLIQSSEMRGLFRDWLRDSTRYLTIDAGVTKALKGCVFEVRQGYKSKDSKRQNADIANAGTAYAQGYLPVVAVLSTQIDSDIAARYASAGWLLLTGVQGDNSVQSVYAFCSQVLRYDLAGFFRKNSSVLKQTVEAVLHSLLSPTAEPSPYESDESEASNNDEADDGHAG